MLGWKAKLGNKGKVIRYRVCACVWLAVALAVKERKGKKKDIAIDE